MMQRRAFLAATAAAAAAVAAGPATLRPATADVLPLGDLPNWRYPDPRVEALDKKFKYKVGNAAIERNHHSRVGLLIVQWAIPCCAQNSIAHGQTDITNHGNLQADATIVTVFDIE